MPRWPALFKSKASDDAGAGDHTHSADDVSGTFSDNVEFDDIRSHNWDGGSDLSGGADGTATAGYFADASAGAAQYQTIYAAGGELGDLLVTGDVETSGSGRIIVHGTDYCWVLDTDTTPDAIIALTDHAGANAHDPDNAIGSISADGIGGMRVMSALYQQLVGFDGDVSVYMSADGIIFYTPDAGSYGFVGAASEPHWGWYANGPGGSIEGYDSAVKVKVASNTIFQVTDRGASQNWLEADDGLGSGLVEVFPNGTKITAGMETDATLAYALTTSLVQVTGAAATIPVNYDGQLVTAYVDATIQVEALGAGTWVQWQIAIDGVLQGAAVTSRYEAPSSGGTQDFVSLTRHAVRNNFAAGSVTSGNVVLTVHARRGGAVSAPVIDDVEFTYKIERA